MLMQIIQHNESSNPKTPSPKAKLACCLCKHLVVPNAQAIRRSRANDINKVLGNNINVVSSNSDALPLKRGSGRAREALDLGVREADGVEVVEASAGVVLYARELLVALVAGGKVV